MGSQVLSPEFGKAIALTAPVAARKTVPYHAQNIPVEYDEAKTTRQRI
jgi:hypothetical protein